MENKLRSKLQQNHELFKAKYQQLEQRRVAFNERLKSNIAELELLRKETSAKAKRKAKKLAKKISFDVRYGYVEGGHIKNEILGMLTIYSFGRSHKVNAIRHIRFDESDPVLYLNIYQNKKRDMSVKAKVFVYIHGGGWIGGWPESREAFTTKVAAAGYFVASLYYGDAPEYAHPKMIENIYKAFAWLKEHADEYNIDMDSIFVGGESAGGHLSAMAGCIATNPEYNARFDLDERSRHQKIKGLVLNCGVYDMEKALETGFHNINIYTEAFCGGHKLIDMPSEFINEVSPINWITKDFPPAYCISAENDKLAVLTFDFVDKLYDLGVYVDHYHAEGKLAVHAFAVSQGFKICKIAMQGTLEFLSGLQNFDEEEAFAGAEGNSVDKSEQNSGGEV